MTDIFNYIQQLQYVVGSFGGGLLIWLSGSGFDTTAANVNVTLTCGSTTLVCAVADNSTTPNSIPCTTPPADQSSGATLACNITVSQSTGAESTLAHAFTYKASLTPIVTAISKTRGNICL